MNNTVMEHTQNKGLIFTFNIKLPFAIIVLVSMAYVMLEMLSQLAKIPPGNTSPLYRSICTAMASALMLQKYAVVPVFLDSLKEKLKTTRIIGGTNK